MLRAQGNSSSSDTFIRHQKIIKCCLKFADVFLSAELCRLWESDVMAIIMMHVLDLTSDIGEGRRYT